MKLTKGEMERIIRKQREEIKALRAVGHRLVHVVHNRAKDPVEDRTYLTDLVEQWDLVTRQEDT